MANEFDLDTAAFVTWLQQQSETTISPKVQIADLRACDSGRGIVCTAPIKVDEELFSIPLANVLTVHNSSLQTIIPEMVDALDAWNALILVMIFEDGKGTESKWWPYLKILPTELDTLMYWSPSELAELHGSAVLDKIGKESANDSFKQVLLPIVQQYAGLFGRHADAFSGPNGQEMVLKLAHRMASLIMAYGFDIEAESSFSSDEEETDDSSLRANTLSKGMIPFADLFNANGDLNNVHLLQQEESMAMVALEDIDAGQQLFNDFGQLPRSDLLRRYGYITDEYKKWDVVEVSIELIAQHTSKYNNLSDRERGLLFKVAETWQVLQDGYDMIRPTKPEEFEFEQTLLLTIYALLLTPPEMDEVGEEAPDTPPPSMTRQLGLVLNGLITSRQNAYPTTLAEDRALLNTNILTGRRRIALEVRLGEKEILAMAADHCKIRYINACPEPEEEDDSTNTKRRGV